MQSGDSTTVFDICDDITSGYMSGYCASVHSELAEIARKARIDSVTATWPEKDRAAYRELRKAASNFFTERVLWEVDMSGTARVAIETEESESLEDGLLARVLDANTCAIPTYTAQEFMAADKKLNAIYKKVMDTKKPARGAVPMEGTVTGDGIRSTQRAWIGYRDAWAAFGAVRCPGVSDNSWKTMITEERIRQLESFIE